MSMPCDCQARQTSSGDTACRSCNGDWFACECPPRPHRPWIYTDCYEGDPPDGFMCWSDYDMAARPAPDNTNLEVHHA